MERIVFPFPQHFLGLVGNLANACNKKTGKDALKKLQLACKSFSQGDKEACERQKQIFHAVQQNLSPEVLLAFLNAIIRGNTSKLSTLLKSFVKKYSPSSQIIETALKSLKNYQSLSIGTQANNTVQFPPGELGCSREHCTFTRVNNTLITALPNAHGDTYINGLLLVKNDHRQLQGGDTITLGSGDPKSAFLSFTIPNGLSQTWGTAT